MKILTFSFFLSFSFGLAAQDKLVGHYRNSFGHHIRLNADNTFNFTWYCDLQSSWTKGIWTFKKDTIYLKMIPIYDTFSYRNSNNLIVDTLILADDEIPKRITPVDEVLFSRPKQKIFPTKRLNSNNMIVDTFIVLEAELPEISLIQNAIVRKELLSGGQNLISCPDKLVLKKGRLYEIQNKRLVTKKQRGPWVRKKFNPWYFRSTD